MPGESRGIERQGDQCEPGELRGRLLLGKTGWGPGTWVTCGKCVHIYVEIRSMLGADCVGAISHQWETGRRSVGPGVEGLEAHQES